MSSFCCIIICSSVNFLLNRNTFYGCTKKRSILQLFVTIVWIIKYSFSINRSNFYHKNIIAFRGSALPLKIFLTIIIIYFSAVLLYLYHRRSESNRARYQKIYTWPLAKRTIHSKTKNERIFIGKLIHQNFWRNTFRNTGFVPAITTYTYINITS